MCCADYWKSNKIIFIRDKMKSPLRYPGGKTRAITSLTYILNTYYGSYKRLVSRFVAGVHLNFQLKIGLKNWC